jgi:hypothetical protein
MSPKIINKSFPAESEPNIILWSIQCYKEAKENYVEWAKCIRKKCSKTWPKYDQVVAGKVSDSPFSFKIRVHKDDIILTPFARNRVLLI